MPDEFDRASEIEERQRAEALRVQRAKTGMVPCGACHYCGEAVAEGRLFCPGVECRDGYEIEQRMRAIRGQKQ